MTETKTEASSAPLSSRLAFLKRLSLAPPDFKAQITFWSIMVGGLVLDLWTKRAVFNRLEPGEVLPVIDGFLQLVRALNDGAAFGMFAGKGYVLLAASVVALVVIFAVFLLRGGRPRLALIALALFASGVCGNLYDRIFNDGLVRDFIDVYYHDYHWPAFNVADSLLCIGVGLLIISNFFTEKPAQRRARQHK